MTDFEDILDKVGHFGLLQKFLYLVVMLTTQITGGFMNLTIVFYAATPEHWCKNPTTDHLNLTLEKLLNLTIPKEIRNGEEVYSQCSRYNVDFGNWTTEDVKNISTFAISSMPDVVKCDNGWHYDHKWVVSSIVTEFDLVCDSKVLVDMVKSSYMAGFMVGVTLFSFLSDWFGRRPAYIASLLMKIMCSFLIILSPNYLMFLILRFLCGVAAIGNHTIAFVIVSEMISARIRTVMAPVASYAWCVSVMVTAGVAYLLREWRQLALALTVPQILTIAFCFLVPESPRWLYANNRHEEADAVVRKMARWNKVQLPEKLDVEVKKSTQSAGMFLDLIRVSKLRRVTLSVCLVWCILAMVYYGLSLSSTDLGGDPFINFFIGGTVELAGTLFCQIALLFFGRRTLLIVFFTLGGISLLCIMAVTKGMVWLLIALAMFGRFCVGNAFLVIYTYTLELFPTVVRNFGLATGSASARIGGIVAPYIGSLVIVNQLIPYTTFGAASIVAALTLLLLPETKDKHLPETTAEYTMGNGEKEANKYQKNGQRSLNESTKL